MKHVKHTKWNFFFFKYNINFIENGMFIGENLWLTIASPASMQFPKDTGFDKGKSSVMTFLNNQ